MRLAVVSQCPALRAGLRALLAGEGLEVVREAAELGELVAGLGDVDVAVVDPADGEAIEAGPTRLVLLGPAPAAEGLLAAGRPWAYLPREAGGEALAQAVRAVAAGLVAIDPALASRVLLAAPTGRSPDANKVGEELTAREREVLAFVAAGFANKEIARKLGISEHTVKFHVAAILGKLGAASRTEAGYLAARRGLIAL